MTDKKERKEDIAPQTEQITPQARPQTWADPGTWSASTKFLPAYVVLIGIFIAIYYNNYRDTGLKLTSYESCVATFNYTFRVNAALAQAHDHSTHSWEIGHAFEATQQIFTPGRSVFSPYAFPHGKIPKLSLRLDEASLYVESKIQTANKTLYDEEDAAVSDPAALGVAAIMFSQRWGSSEKMAAATRQKDVLLNEAPRYRNGAISHRFEDAELWSDAIAMFPPFLAYYGVATDDLDVIRTAVQQIGLYRDVLRIGSGSRKGLWKHIAGPSKHSDDGAWSTGNAWAAYGMARVRATIAAWPKSSAALIDEVETLDTWIQEIFDGAIKTDDDASGLLKNYLGDSASKGETSGTALLSALVYRMAVMRKDTFAQDRYMDWAHRKRRAIFERVDENGCVGPAVNSLKPQFKELVNFSPEGQSFLLLLGTAWRDCVCSSPNGICLATYLEETRSKLAGELSFESLTGHTFESLTSSVANRVQTFLKYFEAP